MKIACYGFVCARAGSVAGANYLIVRTLLERGHHIDFFAKQDFVRPTELFEWPNFTYVGLERPGFLRLERWPQRVGLPGPVGYLASRVSYGAHLRAIRRELVRRHRRAPYDVMLFLGTGAPFALPADLPVVSWLQGPATTEWEALRNNRSQVVAHCGRLTYGLLRAFYLWKERQARKEIERSDVCICISEWSRQRLIDEGVAPDRAYTLPYPFDLTAFAPVAEAPADRPPTETFVWLGRIAPRKRLDLMLDAFGLLAAKRPDVRLHVVGGFDRFDGYRTLLDSFPYPDQLTYTAGIPRNEVPALLRGAAALVQPSENENFGSSVAEALAVGTPVVLGPTNGTRPYAEGACFAFDAYTPDALCDAMERCLAAQAAEPAALARRARHAAETAFRADHVVGQLETILAAAAGEKARASAAEPAPASPIAA